MFISRLSTRKQLFCEEHLSKPLPLPLEFGRFVFSSACAGISSFLASQLASKAFPYPHDPNAKVAMVIAFVFFMVGLGSAAVAGKSFLRLIGMS